MIGRALILLILCTLVLLSGCFVQASMGAQHSPDGTWGQSAGVLAGIHFDVNDVVGVSVGGEGSISYFTNEDGEGHAVTGPVSALVHARVAQSGRHAMAIAGEITAPGISVSLIPDRTEEQGRVPGGRAVRGFLGLVYHYQGRKKGWDGSLTRDMLRATMGLQTVTIHVPLFDDVVTFGPAVSVGYTMTAETVGKLAECIFTFGASNPCRR